MFYSRLSVSLYEKEYIKNVSTDFIHVKNFIVGYVWHPQNVKMPLYVKR